MRFDTNKYFLIAALIIVVGLASCKVATQTYRSPRVSSNMAKKLYRDTVAAGDTTTLADIPWKELFADKYLQQLIGEGLTNNLDLKNAIESINEARASFRESKAAFLPSLQFSPSVTHSKTSAASLNFPSNIGINLKTTTYQLAFSSSWEIDVWGKLSSSKRAALAGLLKSEASKRAVQTQLIADIANYYYALLAYDKELAITQQTVENRRKDVASMKALKDAAKTNGASVVQSEANLYSAEVSIPDLKQSIRETENAICLLLGKEPGPVERATLDEQQVYQGVKTGIPAQLLHNRPDVEEAEFAFRNAFENTNVARANFYPSFSITSASGGVSALSLSKLFSNSLFYSVAGGLTQPIFKNGANKATLAAAKAEQQIALNTYYNTLLTAGKEVTNALYDYQMGMEKETARAKQIASLSKAVDYTKELMMYSSATNYTDVLTSEQSLLAAQLSGVNDKLQQLQAIVNLYKALGGGWKN